MELAPKEELDLLLKSIEEISKHARNTLYLLLLASAFAIISIMSETGAEQLRLPVIDVEISKESFFAITPVLILVLYGYLSIYVHELLVRVAVFDSLEITFASVPHKHMILFPWLLTFSPGSPYAAVLTKFLLFGMGPLVLFTMWLAFLGAQDIVALVPSACFIASLYASRRVVFGYRVAFFLSAQIFLATVANVPDLQRALQIEGIWNLLNFSVIDSFLLFTELYFGIYVILLIRNKESTYHAGWSKVGPGWFWVLTPYLLLTIVVAISILL